MSDTSAFIRGLPKTDLHMHLDGSLEPELLLQLAERNRVHVPWTSVEEVRGAYDFANLQAFLDLFYVACRVLVTEQDFYDLARAYLRRAVADGVIRTELFMGPQSFTAQGMPVAPVLDGIFAAVDDATREADLSVGVIVTAQRHRGEADAFELLQQIQPWRDRILGIGMGGAELGNPPSKFQRFYRACREQGFRITIHAGEEGPPAYIREAVDLLGVDRVDHGVACMDDPDLVKTLVERQLPLTVCPISNFQLKVVQSLEQHPLKRMLQAGLHVTVNSDDPAYFGAYVNDNLIACQQALDLTRDEIVTLVRNGFTAAFVPEHEKQAALGRLDAYLLQLEMSS
jgi:adenosine deaminase